MATCLESIGNGTGHAQLFASTLTPFTISAFQNAIFYLPISNVTKGTFNLIFEPMSSSIVINITITIFAKQGTSFVNIGSASFGDLLGSFSKDFDMGEYFVCIKSNQAFRGTILASLAGYTGDALIKSNLGHGQSIFTNLIISRKPQVCNEEMFFEVVDGELPPGVSFSEFGRIQTPRLPNLDCLPDAVDFSPGQNWYWQDESERTNPIGRMWRFKVRVYIKRQMDTYDEDWFCIRVHNDWSFDRDNFLSQAPFSNIQSVRVVEEAPKLPESYCEYIKCDEIEKSSFAPEEIIQDGLCDECGSEDIVSDVELIRIPFELSQLKASEFVVWWNNNKDSTIHCDDVQTFINNLNGSIMFKKLLKQAGYLKDWNELNSVIAVDLFKEFLQITEMSLIDGRNDDDLDALMLRLRDMQNQKLPIYIPTGYGETMSVRLD